MARQRAMPHIKTFGRYCHVKGEGTRLAWLLLTSHNLSKAAWGSLQAGKNKPALTLNQLQTLVPLRKLTP